MKTLRASCRVCGVLNVCWLALLLALLGAGTLSGAEDPTLVAPTEPLSAEEQQKLFHLPPGFEIQLIASEPEIRKPMNLAWDDQGRLWATQSIEYPWPADPAQAVPRDTVRIFSELAPNGRAGKVSVFADGLNIPIGLMPLRDGALVYSIPRIERHYDSDANGTSDSREPAFAEFGFRDTHGMASSFTPWIDGWTYGCHGFSNDSSVAGQDGKAIQMNSGNTYRFKADGSTIEYFTHGQVNPFGLCFDNWGNLYSADCHTLPVYLLLRNAWYPSFGKPHDGLGFGPPILEHLHGSTGIAGVVVYLADHFPPAYRNTVFVGNPVTGRINHDHLQENGSAFRAIEQPDFLTCDDPWFRPVDIKLGPDGALYIADFYNCIIGHYEVPLEHPRRDRERGRLWRVVYRGAQPDAVDVLPPPHNTRAATPDELIAQLSSPNLLVRTRATNALVERGRVPETKAKLEDLLQRLPAGQAQVHAMWVLERLYTLPESTLESLSLAVDPQVRVHLLRLLAERVNWEANGPEARLAERGLRDPHPIAQRVAADALGRNAGIVQGGYLQPLLKAALKAQQSGADPHYTHTLKMAIRDHLMLSAGCRAALDLATTEDAFAPLLLEAALGAPVPHASQLVAQLLTRHAELEPFAEATGFCVANLPVEALNASFFNELRTSCQNRGKLDLELQVLRQLQQKLLQRGLPQTPEFQIWLHETLTRALQESKGATLQVAAELARHLQADSVVPQLNRLVLNPDADAAARVAAIKSLFAIAPQGSLALLQTLVQSGDFPLDLRNAAAELLVAHGDPSANPKALELLTGVPRSLAVTLSKGLAGSSATAEKLLELIALGKAPADLLQEPAVKERLLASGLPDISSRIDALTANIPARDERLSQQMSERLPLIVAAGNEAKLTAGKEAFEKRCGICHRLKGAGQKVGPELDGVAIRGPERLLEDILDPSRNVDQAFRATLFQTKDGQTLSGLFLRNEGETVVYADALGKEQLLPRDIVESQSTSNLSPMPGNFADAVSADELAAIVAYLLSTKPVPQP